jgi:outer membrane protein TolC
MNYRLLLACLFLGLTSFKGYGQDPNVFSLPQLWEEAYTKYPSMKAYQARLEQAKLNQKLVRNQYLPDLRLQAQNTLGSQKAVGGAFFPLPGLYNVGGSGSELSTAPAVNLFGSAVLDWQFFQFGKHKKEVEAAKVLSREAGHQLQAEQLAIQGNVSRSFLRLLFHQQMQVWAKQNAERLQTLFTASKSLAQAGLSSGADSLLIKASLKQTLAMFENWQGQKEESTLALAMWVNRPAEELQFKTHAFPAAAPFSAGQESESHTSLHPQMAIRREAIAYAGKLKELSALKVLPTLSLLGGIQVRDHAQKEALEVSWSDAYKDPVSNYLLGAGLSWNLGNFFDYRFEQARYQEMIRQRQAEAQEVALGLSSREQMAQRQLIQALQQIKSTEEAYAAAQMAYRQFEKRYQNGLISISELLQIQDVLQKTEKSRIEAYYQYWNQQVNRAEASADFSLLQNVFQ